MSIDAAMSAAHAELDAHYANAVRNRCADRVRKMLCEIVGAGEGDPRRQLSDDATLAEWKADSFDQLELTLSVEDEFDIDVLEVDAPQLDTVAKIVAHIMKGPTPKGVIA